MQGKLHILVADDDGPVGNYLRFCLGLSGHKVTVVEGGRELIDRCRESPPDVVLTDMNMPDMSGLDAAMEIRTFSPVPIVLMSGRWEDEQLEVIEAAARCTWLTKPFGRGELTEAIANCLA